MDLAAIGSFKARLRSLGAGCSGMVAVTEKLSEFDSGGWLVVDERCDGGVAAELNFNFLESRGNRVHYAITNAAPGPYRGAKLGISRNGFLGLYLHAAVTDFWKVELLGGSAVNPQIYLRNHEGTRVGFTVRRENISSAAPLLVERNFLTVTDSVLRFCLEDIVAL